MKFLLECVNCYGTASPDSSHEDSSKLASPSLDYRSSRTSQSSSTEESVAGALRRRSRSLSRLNPGDWKPSLHAISEDNVIAPVKPKEKTAEQMSRRSSGRCASSSPRSNSRRRTDTYAYGRDTVQMIVPTFSPTPFMF